MEVVKSEFSSQNITVIDKSPYGEYRPYQKSRAPKLKITDVLNKQNLKPFYYVDLLETTSVVPSNLESPVQEYEESEDGSSSSFFLTQFEEKETQETKSVDEIPTTSNSVTKEKSLSRVIKSASNSRLVATRNTQPVTVQKTTPEKRYMTTPDALVHYDYNADWFQLESTIDAIEKELVGETEVRGTTAIGSRIGTSSKLDKQSPYAQLKNTLEKPFLSVTSSKFTPKERLSTKMKKREEDTQKNIQNLYKVTH